MYLFDAWHVRIDGLFRPCIKFEKSEMIKINKIIRRETNFNDLLRACADRNTTLLSSVPSPASPKLKKKNLHIEMDKIYRQKACGTRHFRGINYS